MSYELINRITIKKNGVYLSSHSNNDNSPFYSRRNNSLSKIYKEEGQEGLDREIIFMLYNYAELSGHHPSVMRYRHAMNKGQHEYHKCVARVEKAFDALSEEDKENYWSVNSATQFPAIQSFREFEKKATEEMCSAIACYCGDWEVLSPKNPKTIEKN